MRLLEYFFLLMCIIQLYYYLYYFAKLAFNKENQNKNTEEPVSIIIAAKNEEHALKSNLSTILNQVYACFEVIVVNNLSTDKTKEYLESVGDNKLRILDCNEEGKKAALIKGIQAAKYEKLLFIDADCKPNSSNWLKYMIGELNGEKEIVLGFGAFEKNKSLINKLIRFENVLNATQYFSFALRGEAYMGVGRNLAYTKSIFNQSESFEIHKNVQSGDDDLLVNEMATNKNVAICVTPFAHTTSKAENSWSSLFHQKRRQLVAGNYYKTKHKLNLALFGATNFLYYCLFITMLAIGYTNIYIIMIFVAKQLLEYFLFSKICAKLDNQEIPKWIVILEPLYLIFITLVGTSTWVWKVDKWK